MKKIFAFFITVFAAVLLMACGESYKVTFDYNYAGGPEAVVIDVKDGGTVAKPTDPVRDGYTFEGWNLAGAEGTYDFEGKINVDLTLIAGWKAIKEPVEIVDPKVVTYTAPVYKGEEKVIRDLRLPGKTEKDLNLSTQFVGEDQLTWESSNEDVITPQGKVTRQEKNVAVKLTATLGELTREFWVTVYGNEVDLYATYNAAYSEIVTLNPLMSTGTSDSDVFDNLVSSFYGGDYDWEKAMKDGYADFPGDFSKIKSDRNPEGTVEMPSIAYKQTLGGMAATYPYAYNKKTDNVIEGSHGVLLDQQKAKDTLDTIWVVTLRNDLVFQDGTPINVDTVEYSFQQYLNGDLANARANYLYEGDYIPLLNGKNYYDGETTWDKVGFTKIDNLTFIIELNDAISQYDVMTYLGIINLVHIASFKKGFNATGTENNYGSVDNPLVSYGPFALRNDYNDTNVFTFDKNFKYFAAWDIPFTMLRGPIIKDQSQVINEFRVGKLDVAGVGGEFWNEFRDHKNLYISPSNSFYRFAISIERPVAEGKADKSKPILKYDDFRRALYLATDRDDFANNVQPPSEGALGFLSNIHQVSEWASEAYAASDKFFNQLDGLGLNPESGGYDSQEAYDLFIKARAEAIKDGKYKAGEVIELEFLFYDAGSNTRIANWAKAQYEKVFNKNGKENNLVIKLNPVSNDELSAQRNAGDFDLVFTGMSGATFQATFGMGYIFSRSFSTFLVGKGHGIGDTKDKDGKVVKGKAVTAEILNLYDLLMGNIAAVGVKTKDTEVDETKDYYTRVANTDGKGYLNDGDYKYTIVKEPTKADLKDYFEVTNLGTDDYDEAKVKANEGKRPAGMRSEAHQAFLGNKGVFEGTFDELFIFFSNTPELGVDYDGQEEDLTNITAALEKALLEQMVAVPLFSSTSAVVYSDQVVRLAHAYHLFLGWGGMSYMYKTKASN